ncbi:uncharacterized protein METZ01_LOCUS332843, partial [marine metagenome]
VATDRFTGSQALGHWFEPSRCHQLTDMRT